MRRFSREWWAAVYERHPRAQLLAAVLIGCFAAYLPVHALLDWNGFHNTWDDTARSGDSGPWILLACAPIMLWASLKVGRIARRRMRGEPLSWMGHKLDP